MAGIAPTPDEEQDAPPAPDASAPTDQPQQGIAPGDKGGSDELGDEEGMSPNVSPEEQQQYEEFVLSGLAMIYDKPQGDDGKGGSVRPGILKLLDDDPSDLKAILKADELQHFSPLVAIAATAALIVVHIQQIAKGTPDEPSDDVALHGGAAILEELAEIWMRRNKQQLQEDDVHRALTMAMDIYREVGADAGLVDENALKDEFAQLVRADKEGKLAEVSPDLAGINKAAEINATEGDDPAQEQQAPDGQQPPAPDEEQQ